MNTLLICPGPRAGVPLLSAAAPLACVPMLGQSLLDYWLDHLAGMGAKHVRILVSDRPGLVHADAGEGERWGMHVEVIPLDDEPTPEEAQNRYGAGGAGWLPAPADVVRIDHLPGRPDHPLFDSYASWFQELVEWMPRAQTPLRVGLRELSPGVWVGLHSHVAHGAQLRAPCWLGNHVRVGPGAVVGPRAVVEDRGWVDRDSEIVDSFVGQETFVGELCELHDSVALGGTLLNWRDGASVNVADPYLLSNLGSAPPRTIADAIDPPAPQPAREQPIPSIGVPVASPH